MRSCAEARSGRVDPSRCAGSVSELRAAPSRRRGSLPAKGRNGAWCEPPHLTGLRKRELYFLTWRDLDLRVGTLRVSGAGKVGFSPKDYEERPIPLPPDLIEILSALPRRADWVFPSRKGTRLTHLLRRLKTIAARAGVPEATLHKFRHTYGTRLLEQGADRYRAEAHGAQRYRDHSQVPQSRGAGSGEADHRFRQEADQHSGRTRSAVGAKRRWPPDCAGSDRHRQEEQWKKGRVYSCQL